MTKKVVFSFITFFLGLLVVFHRAPVNLIENEKEDHAMEMFDWWYSQRALPFGYIPAGAFQKALVASKQNIRKERFSASGLAGASQWTSLGPNNIGGRILALAIDPGDTNTIWAGAASGGLWKSTTGGVGTTGWTFVNTGYPALSVSTIAINPSNPNLMYIGTGELSFYHFGLVGTPGARSSYGIGILRSTDGGATWGQTNLAWTIPQVTGVQKIIINPINTSTLYAATTEGVYKSTDAGVNWGQSSTVLMAMDIVMSPDDTSTLYASHGNLNSTVNPGIYKTTNSGTTWVQLSAGLPTSNFGRTALAISPSAPAVIYAGISNGDPNNGGMIGLYVSTDRGSTWGLKNGTNYVSSQGWYDNVVAVNPLNADSVFCAGLDVYLSVDGGTTLTQISDWTGFNMGTPVPGGAEGTSIYVHADQHAIVFNPLRTRTMYVATDGGVFKTLTGGDIFFGINGGLVTTQFYSGFISSESDSTIAVGGLQDNGVIKYQGSTAWRKIDVGDGGWNAIDPTNNSIMYDEYVYLSLSKSTNGGSSFFSITNNLPGGPDNANFIAPFVLAHSNPGILYAGTKNIYKSTNGGLNWFATNNGADLNGTKISCIGVSYGSSDTLMAGTGSSVSSSPVFQIWASTNGGSNWTNVTDSLPSRYPTDIAFDPTNSMTAYVTFSGYGSPHIFRTTNLGQSWSDISSGVDVPHQSIAVDPADPGNLYAGTDLGVYHSSDYGTTWEQFNAGMNPAMVLDLSISPADQSLRAATFGSGVYERKLVRIPRVTVVSPNGGEIFVENQFVQLAWTSKFLNLVRIEYSLDNGTSWHLIADSLAPTVQSYNWTVPDTVTSAGLIRVSDPTIGGVSDLSDGNFTIDATSDVLIGWNLLSLDLSPFNPVKTSLFPTAVSSAFIYGGGYIPVDSLNAGEGFWLKFSQPYSFSYPGDTVRSETLAVKAGWNIIGGPSKTVPAGAISAIPAGIISSPFYGYRGAYYTSDSLVPKQGYWVKVKSDGQLILTVSADQPAVQKGYENPAFTSITLTDGEQRSQRLYLTGGNADMERYELPPLPPEGAFDIRFGSQRNLELLSLRDGYRQEIPILLRGVRFPVTVHTSIQSAFQGSLRLRDASGNVYPMGQSDIVIAGEADRLILEYVPGFGQGKPAAFELGQNYPNPFNPSTTIRYGIASPAHVKIILYTMLGQALGVLVDRREDAGEYEVQWNGESYPSGIYIYKIIVTSPSGGEMTKTRKMVLLR